MNKSNKYQVGGKTPFIQYLESPEGKATYEAWYAKQLKANPHMLPMSDDESKRQFYGSEEGYNSFSKYTTNTNTENSSAASPTFEYTPEEEAQIQANNKAGLYDKTAETILDLYQKNKRTTFSPITQSGENELQFNAYTPNGNFDFSDGFKIFNTAAQTVTGFANFINDQKQRKQENEQYIKALQPRANYNINEQGINNIPIYKGGGTAKQNPPKVYTDPVLYNKAAQSYNDSLAAYNHGIEVNNIIRKTNTVDNGDGKPLRVKGSKGRVETRGSADKFFGRSQEDWLSNLFGTVPSYYNNGTGKEMIPESITRYPAEDWYNIGSGWAINYKQPTQPIRYQENPSEKTTYSNKPSTYVPKTSTIKKSITPSQISKRMESLKSQNVKVNNSEINMKGQTINLPKMELPQQHGKPIYGPGSTIIGYVDENRNFKKAYSFTGSEDNEHNLQDKYLLEDEDALRQYVRSKESYSFQEGGDTYSPFGRNKINFSELEKCEVYEDTNGEIQKIPIYKGGGTTKQNPPKVYTDPALYNKAAQNYNDSLALYNYTKLQKKVEPKSKLDFLLSPIAELKIKDEGMAEQKGTFESIIKRNKSVNGNIREDGTRYGNSRLWSLGQNDTEHQILYEEANKIIKNSNGRIQYSNSAGSPDLVHPYIHNNAMWRGYGNNNDYSNTYPKQPVKYQPQRTVNTYPKQPVKYQPQRTVNTTNNTPQTFKQINKNTLQIIPNTSQLPKNTHPTTRMQTLHPVNIGADNPQVVMKGQSINLPEPILPQQHGKPIYGPGSTIIGYVDNNRKFKKANFTGSEGNEHNLQDK